MRLLTKASSSAVLFKLDLRFKDIISMPGSWAILPVSPECLLSLHQSHRNSQAFLFFGGGGKRYKLLCNGDKNLHVGILLKKMKALLMLFLEIVECEVWGSYQFRHWCNFWTTWKCNTSWGGGAVLVNGRVERGADQAQEEAGSSEASSTIS